MYAVFANDLVETIATLTDRLIEHDVSSVSADSAWLAKKILANDDKKELVDKKKEFIDDKKTLTVRKRFMRLSLGIKLICGCKFAACNRECTSLRNKKKISSQFWQYAVSLSNSDQSIPKTS